MAHIDLEALLDAIARASVGDLRARAPISPDAEPSDDAYEVLAHSLNVLFADLELRDTQLRDERARVQAILDQMPNAVAICSAPSGRIVYYNEAAKAMTGTPEVERIEDYGEAFPARTEDGLPVGPDDWPFARVLRRGERVRGLVMETMTPSGPRAFSVHAGPIHDASGALVGAVCIYYDITDERRVAAELRAERDLSATLLSAVGKTGVGLTVVRDDTFVFLNDAFARIVGYTAEELRAPGFDRLALVPADQRAARLEERRAGVPGDRALAEVQLLRKDGSIATVERASALIDRGQGPERLGIYLDVSQRRAAELAAEDQRKLYATLMRAESELDQGVVVTDGSGRIVYANEAYVALTGYPLGELTAPSFSTSVLYTPETADILRQRAQAMATGAQVSKTLEIELIRKDGSHVWVEVAVTSTNVSGRLARVAILRDITVRRANEEQIASMRAQLAQMEKMSAMGQLVAGVAHELKTPLSYLSNNVHLIESRLARAVARGEADPKLLDDLKPLAQETLGGVDRINRLVGDLRRFGKPRGTSLRGRIGEGAREAARIFEATHGGQAKLKVSIRDADETCRDVIAVQQVVLNLLENAADASPPGSPVTLRVEGEQDAVRIEVSDEGAGIPLEVQHRMFEPFFTTKADGTGLGLAIVKRILDGMGAEILVDSAPGKGTRVLVRLPRSG